MNALFRKIIWWLLWWLPKRPLHSVPTGNGQPFSSEPNPDEIAWAEETGWVVRKLDEYCNRNPEYAERQAFLERVNAYRMKYPPMEIPEAWNEEVSDLFIAATAQYLDTHQAAFNKLYDHLTAMIHIFQHDLSAWDKSKQSLFSYHDRNVDDITGTYVSFPIACVKARRELNNEFNQYFESNKDQSPIILSQVESFRSRVTDAKPENIELLMKEWDEKLYGQNIHVPVALEVWDLIASVDDIFKNKRSVKDFPVENMMLSTTSEPNLEELAFAEDTRYLARKLDEFCDRLPGDLERQAFINRSNAYKLKYGEQPRIWSTAYMDLIVDSKEKYELTYQPSFTELYRGLCVLIRMLQNDLSSWDKVKQAQFSHHESNVNEITNKHVEFPAECINARRELQELDNQLNSNSGRNSEIFDQVKSFRSRVIDAELETIKGLKEEWDEKLYGQNLHCLVALEVWDIIVSVDDLFKEKLAVSRRPVDSLPLSHT